MTPEEFARFLKLREDLQTAKRLLLACLEAGHLRDEKYRDLYIETCRFLGRTAEI